LDVGVAPWQRLAEGRANARGCRIGSTDAAARFGITSLTLCRLIDDGELRVSHGSRDPTKVSDLDAFIVARESSPARSRICNRRAISTTTVS
jgi:hypothetical protein